MTTVSERTKGSRIVTLTAISLLSGFLGACGGGGFGGFSGFGGGSQPTVQEPGVAPDVPATIRAD
ncbi:MAG: hypothetical protein ACJAVZ_003708, partial [Afipia broomeae]